MAQTKYRKKVCQFCKENNEPDYKDVTTLRRYTTEKGKIIPRTKSGLCAKHGRLLSTAVKRARFMVLIPYTTKLK